MLFARSLITCRSAFARLACPAIHLYRAKYTMVGTTSFLAHSPQQAYVTILFVVSTEPVQVNPCSPSPCGPNSQCRELNDQAVCSCLLGYLGSPPSCRPECVVNSDCNLDEACTNQKCRDPCPGTCGNNALCHVKNHNPICSCRPAYTGNPFTSCTPIGERNHNVNFKSVSGLFYFDTYFFTRSCSRNATTQADEPLYTVTVRS